MKKILFLTTIIVLSTTALAFGGHSKGRISTLYKAGVDAIGVYYGGDDKPDVDFECDDPNAHPTEQGVCICNDGYVKDSSGICVINRCADFTPTDCIPSCNPVTGEKTYAELCNNGLYYCDESHNCVNPCDGAYNEECQTCTPGGRNTTIQDKSGPCGTDHSYICQEGSCVDPCSIGDHPTDNCTPSWHTENGECVPDYAEAGTSCGTNKTCDANHECSCIEGYFEVASGELCRNCSIYYNSDTEENWHSTFISEKSIHVCDNTEYPRLILDTDSMLSSASCAAGITGHTVISKENCDLCQKTNYPHYYIPSSEQCPRCPSIIDSITDQSACTQCGGVFKNDTCCPTNIETITDATKCTKCEGYFYRNACHTQPLPCPESASEATGEEDCTCKIGRFWNGTACFEPCSNTNNFHRLSGTCLACDSSTRVETTATECRTCGDQRKVVTVNDKTYCATTNCGTDKFIDINGTCHACSIATSYVVENAAECTTSCPTRHIETRTDGSLSCVKGCAEGYEEIDGVCLLPCPTGQERNPEGECVELCPEERQCGETCCGEGNICVDGNKCCLKYAYEADHDDSVCCPVSGSKGFSAIDWECCGAEQSPYLINDDETKCCDDTIYSGVGLFGASVCCDHEPEDYTRFEGMTFKVCWTENTTCKSHEDCENGEYCLLREDEDKYDIDEDYPTSGTCFPITESDYIDANIQGLGMVRRSTHKMNWWTADDWCQAQGKSLIDFKRFGCYHSGTSDLIPSQYDSGYCCIGNNQSCSAWFNYWDGNTIKDTYETIVNTKYSAVAVNLRKAFGEKVAFWTLPPTHDRAAFWAYYLSILDAYMSRKWLASNKTATNAVDLYALCQ